MDIKRILALAAAATIASGAFGGAVAGATPEGSCHAYDAFLSTSNNFTSGLRSGDVAWQEWTTRPGCEGSPVTIVGYAAHFDRWTDGDHQDRIGQSPTVRAGKSGRLTWVVPQNCATGTVQLDTVSREADDIAATIPGVPVYSPTRDLVYPAGYAASACTVVTTQPVPSTSTSTSTTQPALTTSTTAVEPSTSTSTSTTQPAPSTTSTTVAEPSTSTTQPEIIQTFRSTPIPDDFVPGTPSTSTPNDVVLLPPTSTTPTSAPNVPGSLPFTGLDLVGMLKAAGALVGAGGLFWAVGARRNRTR